jgi:hypothetical protein
MDLIALTLIIGLAAFRLWRLGARDSITARPRQWLYNRLPSVVSEMVDCCWCLGSWLAFGLTAAAYATAPFAYPWLVGLAAAATTGWIGRYMSPNES